MEEVGSLHRLPFLKSRITVLAVIGSRTRILADLPAFIGCPAAHGAGKAYAFLLSDTEPVQGFLVATEPVTLGVRPEAVIPPPDYLSVPLVEGCLDQDGTPIPMLNVSTLYSQVRKGAAVVDVSAAALPDCRSDDAIEGAGFRTFSAAGSLFAMRESRFVKGALDGYQLLRFPLLPSDIDGIAVSHDRMLPMIDVACRITGQSRVDSSALLEATLGDASIGLLVDEDRGAWARDEAFVRDVPPAARVPWLRSAAVRNGEIAAVIDLGEMLRHPRAAGGVSERAPDHEPTSKFPVEFGAGDVRVVEFSIAGHRHAVPESEVAGVIPCQEIRPLPFLPLVLAGVSDYEGALLPVVDIARIHGVTGEPQWSESMILLANGGFRALVIAQHVFEARTVRLDEQRPVPVTLSFPVVYGCYTDGDAVRLIFNMESLVSHSEESRLAEIVPAPVPEELAPTPAREEPLPAPLPVEIERAPDVPPPEPAVEEVPVIAAAPPAAPLEEEVLVPIEQEVEIPAEPEHVPEETTVAGEPQPEEPQPIMAAAVEPQERVERPGRPWGYRLLGFVASALVILGAGAGLWLTEEARKPNPVQDQKPAPQETAEPVMTPAPVAPSASETSPYVVQRGDTLWDIANRLTGNPLNYRSLAGRNRIPNPDLIFPGQTLETTETR